MPTLSSLLVQRSVASMQAVEDAIARQVLYGDDLATNVLEVGAAREDDVTRLTAESLGMFALPSGKITLLEPGILRLLTGDVAQRYGIFPIEKRGGDLVVATSEPLSQNVEEDLGFLLNLNLRPVYALHVRIVQALADHYGKPIERRYARLLAKLEGRKTGETEPPPAGPPGANIRHTLVGVAAPRAMSPAHEDAPTIKAAPRAGLPAHEDAPTIKAAPPVPKGAPPAALLAKGTSPAATPARDEAPAVKAGTPGANILTERPTLRGLPTVPPDEPWGPAPDNAASSLPATLDLSPRPPAAGSTAASQVSGASASRGPSSPPVASGTAPQGRAPSVPPTAAPLASSPLASSPAPGAASEKAAGASDQAPTLAAPAVGASASEGVPEALTSWARPSSAEERPIARSSSGARKGSGAAAHARDARQALSRSRRKGPFPASLAEEEMQSAVTTDGVLEVFFDFAQQYFEYAALFVVHGDIAEGRDAAGRGADRARVAAVGLPLDLPSTLAAARDRRVPVLADFAVDGLDAELLQDLGRAPAVEGAPASPTAPPNRAPAAVIPIIVRGRAVALLFGDDAPAPVELTSIGDVIAFAALAGASVERIILRKKLGRSGGSSRLTPAAAASVAPRAEGLAEPPKPADARTSRAVPASRPSPGGAPRPGVAALARMFGSAPSTSSSGAAGASGASAKAAAVGSRRGAAGSTGAPSGASAENTRWDDAPTGAPAAAPIAGGVSASHAGAASASHAGGPSASHESASPAADAARDASPPFHVGGLADAVSEAIASTRDVSPAAPVIVAPIDRAPSVPEETHAAPSPGANDQAETVEPGALAPLGDTTGDESIAIALQTPPFEEGSDPAAAVRASHEPRSSADSWGSDVSASPRATDTDFSDSGSDALTIALLVPGDTPPPAADAASHDAASARENETQIVPDDALETVEPAPVEISVPIDVEPSAPLDAELSAPVDAELSAPIDAELSAPIDVEPSAPIDVEPSAPIDVEPSAPIDVEPSAPIDTAAASAFASSDRSGAAGDAPSTSGDRPSAAGDRPSAAGDRPSVAGDRPTSSDGRPSAPIVVDVFADSTEGLASAIARAAEEASAHAAQRAARNANEAAPPGIDAAASAAQPPEETLTEGFPGAAPEPEELAPSASEHLPFATPPVNDTISPWSTLGADALLARASRGPDAADARAELRRRAERNLAPLLALFPGPLDQDRHRSAERLPPASQCGPLLDAFAHAGPRGAATAAVLARHDDVDVRFWAAHLLGEIASPEAADGLLAFLVDPDAAVRRIALRSAGLLLAAALPGRPLEAALGYLARDAQTPLRERVAAIDAMGQLRTPFFVPVLIGLLGAVPDEVGEAARRALLVLTRQDFARDAARWNEWWSRNDARHRIEWLIDALMHDTQSIRRAAGDELKSLTKEYFGYYDDLPRRERERAQERYRDWWEREGRARFK